MRQDNAKVMGNWLPDDRQALNDWVNKLIQEVQSKNLRCAVNGTGSNDGISHEEVRKLKELIEKDAGLFILANKMISQALKYSEEDPTGAPQIDSYQLMLQLIDAIMTKAPEYNVPGSKGHSLIGFPINAILNWCMGTQAGYAFFLDSKVNKCFKDILNKWCEFLDTSDSKYVLDKDKENSWLCPEAREELNIEEFKYDPSEKYGGFKSWNNFFIREFKDIQKQRPVINPEDNSIIVNACESAAYRISRDVKKDQKFWLKGQPYSLEYMLNKSKYVDEFIGGIVYQAFLSATKYHRWHSPVNGTIEKIELIPGTYYSEIRSYPYDEAGPNNSQGFITQVATRAVIYIRCPKPIGLMCFIAVGMAEVSSCIITVKEGQEVKKGEQLGYFQFGGSTHCLIFRKDVIKEFVVDAIPAPDFNDSKVINVNAKLAVVSPN